jgi:broad specificity phosphatase PhoE
MLTFPLPAPLKNNYVLVRSGECFADARHETQTNPVKKLRQDNALTNEGREQMVNVAKKLTEMDYNPSFIWTSNTERSYEAAMIIARELQLGQNRIVPEYSFLDARSVGIFEGKNDADTWLEIHKGDSAEGTAYRPPPNNDGTPSESVRDVLVRGNQLVSTIESMHTGENVVIVSPDSDNLSILAAALSSEEVSFSSGLYMCNYHAHERLPAR